MGTYVHEVFHAVTLAVANFSAHTECAPALLTLPPHTSSSPLAAWDRRPLVFSEVGATLAAAGLALDAATGTISGTLVTISPGEVTYSFIVRVTDGLMRSSTRDFTLTSTTNTPPYFAPTAQTGATQPYYLGDIFDSGLASFGHLASLAFDDAEAGSGQVVTHSVVGGALPPGVTLAADGSLGGAVSSNAGVDTSYTFTVRATDGIEPTSADFTLRVRAPIYVDLCNNTGTPGSCTPCTPGSCDYTAPGAHSGVWLPPADLSVEVLVVAAGGNTDSGHGGGPSGAGAVVHHTSYAAFAGVGISYTIGDSPAAGTSDNGGLGHSSIFGSIEAKGGGTGGTNQGGANGGANGNQGGSCACCRHYSDTSANRLVSTAAGGTAYEGYQGGGKIDNHWDWGTGGGAGAGGDGAGAYGYAGGNSDCGGFGWSTAVAGGAGVYFASFAGFGESGWFAGGTRGGQGICTNRNANGCQNVGPTPNNPLSGNNAIGWFFGGGTQPGTIIIKY